MSPVYGPQAGGGYDSTGLPPGVYRGPLYGVWATAQQFTMYNPILPLGDIGFENDTTKFKVADGTSDWNTLPYWTP